MNDTSRPTVIAIWIRNLLLLYVLASNALISFERGRQPSRYDFKHFYLDAAYVWQHGALNPDLDGPDIDARRQLPFYLPAVSVAIAPISFAGREIAAAIWAALQTVSLGYCLLVLRRWCETGRDARHAAMTTSTLILLALPALYEASKFNQVSYFTLALLLAFFTAIERNSQIRAGLWLAAATVLKILPALIALWLILRKQIKVGAAFAVGVITMSLLPSLLAFGFARTAAYHQEWWAYNVADAGPRKWMEQEEWGPHSAHFVDRRNQSVHAVVGRMFWAEHRFPAEWQPAHFSAERCILLANAILFALLAGLVALTWQMRKVPDSDHWRTRAELSIFAIGLLVLAPLSRMYYLVWALPALALLLRAATEVRRTAGMGWARAGVLIWLIGMIAWTSRHAREFGVHTVMLVLMVVCLWRVVNSVRHHLIAVK
ncbi:MAG: glycosyltransferase family 87 protein [Phycisphaerae bacterium]